MPLNGSRTGQFGKLVLKFKSNHLRTPTRMIAPQLTQRIHDFCVGRLGNATLLVVGSHRLGTALFEAKKQALHRSYGNRKLLSHCLWIGLVLPTVKKSCAGGGLD
jgi:hypothetical protein